MKTLSHYGKNSVITKNELKYPCSSYSVRIRDNRDTDSQTQIQLSKFTLTHLLFYIKNNSKHISFEIKKKEKKNKESRKVANNRELNSNQRTGPVQQSQNERN